ncbi:MAG: ribonuclease R [Bacteroidales bacterium]|nr:ribonuclease R [Bacteroidales bacterium]
MSQEKKSKSARKRANVAAKKATKGANQFTAQGKVQMSRDGYAFVILQDEATGEYIKDESRDVFVPASRSLGALHNDIVIVKYTRYKLRSDFYKNEGRVVEIVERSKKPFIGVLHFVGKQCWVLMESKNMPYDIRVDYNAANLEYNGYKVSAVVDEWNNWDPAPKGHIVDILGPVGSNETEMHAILAEFDLPYRFTPEVEEAAEKIPSKITAKDIKNRLDCRGILTFTIDPAEAKDFDDALSFEALDNGNFRVGVHIADVSHYVLPGDIVDRQAYERGTSVYLVDRTVPMLPEKLSNNLCSLRPGEDKLCYSVITELTPEAGIVDRKIVKTIICSDYRFDYGQAQAIIDENVADTPVKSALLTINSLARILRRKRFEKGAISFERPEMKVRVDEEGKPVEVYQKIATESNWLIEEFMLLANRTVAETIAKMKKTFVYRVHDEPNGEKIENLRRFAKNFGFTMGPTGNPKETAASLNELLSSSKDSPAGTAFEMLSLRSMAKAVYTTENIGHYGLAFPYYTHFTSPIRRYPDLMVHRLLYHYLGDGKNESKERYEAFCQHCSAREQVATDAERASIKYKLVEFMQDKVGQEFEGTVSGVTEWGMYVEIEPTKIEGMITLRDMTSDFYQFDEKKYAIIGRRKHRKYTLGSKVRIKVKKASLEQKLLDFILLEK